MKLPLAIPKDKRYFRNMSLLYPVVIWLGGSRAWKAASAGTDWIVMNVWLVVTLLFLVFFIRTLRKWLDPKPAFLLEKDGLTDNVSIVKAGKIAWEDISGAKYEEYAGAKQVIIDVHSPERYTKYLKYLNGKIADQMITDEGTPIMASDKFIRYDCSKLVDEINKRAKG